MGTTVADRFRVVELIARGGMGRVYRAEQAPLGRMVAVKVLTRTGQEGHDADFSERFFLEASTTSRLTHPNTVTIFDYGHVEEADLFWIAMELLEGRTLQRALREDGAFNPARAVRIGSQIARSLREAHRQGIVHRDLKPGNVFLIEHDGDPDFVKVLDFGLVKVLSQETDSELTQAGTFLGSPKYMAPEQGRGGVVDVRTDVYALGVLLYQMLTGRVPFDGTTSVDVLLAHVNEPVPPMAERAPEMPVPAPLEAVVRVCLAKDPARRFPSMEAVLTALSAAAQQAGLLLGSGSTTSGRIPEALLAEAEAEAEGVDEPAAGFELSVARRPSRPAWVGPLLLSLVAVGLGLGGWLVLRPPTPEPSEEVAEATTPAPPEAAPEAPLPPPEPEPAPEPVLDLLLASEPAGATVRLDGRTVCGATPCELRWTGEEARPEGPLTFAFERAGYRSETVRGEVSGERLEVRASLERLPPPEPPRPRARPRPAPAPEPEPAPEPDAREGYKDNPY